MSIAAKLLSGAALLVSAVLLADPGPQPPPAGANPPPPGPREGKKFHRRPRPPKAFFSKLTEEERLKAETAEELTNLRTQLQELQLRETKAQYVAKLVEQGYEPDLAADTAAALVGGDMTTVFANQRKFLDTYAQQVVADQLKSTPRPPAGAASGTDYQKLIDDALESGDQAKAAYYIRLQETAKNK